MKKSDSESGPWQAALAATPAHTPARILVAEDDDAVRCVVVEALREDGYAVTEVCDGGRLLVRLAREYGSADGDALIDVLVSDVKMPVCTGLQILEQLRAANWPVRVILMTAFADEHTRNRARALGAILFDKPFDVAELSSAVACLLERAPAGSGPSYSLA